jgi:hypothetical protein
MTLEIEYMAWYGWDDYENDSWRKDFLVGR